MTTTKQTPAQKALVPEPSLLQKALNTPQEVTIADRVFKLHKLTFRQLAEIERTYDGDLNSIPYHTIEGKVKITAQALRLCGNDVQDDWLYDNLTAETIYSGEPLLTIFDLTGLMKRTPDPKNDEGVEEAPTDATA